MKHPERVEHYLEHIAGAIDRALRYIQPLGDLADFEKNGQVQDAVVRNIEIIGEAVNKINRTNSQFIKEHPEIPWQQMRGMRNVAIHEYFFVDLQIVWATIREDFPKLKKQIEALLNLSSGPQ